MFLGLFASSVFNISSNLFFVAFLALSLLSTSSHIRFEFVPTSGLDPSIEQAPALGGSDLSPQHRHVVQPIYPGSRERHGLVDCTPRGVLSLGNTHHPIACLFGGQAVSLESWESFGDLWAYNVGTHVWTFVNTADSGTVQEGKNFAGTITEPRPYPGSRYSFGFVRTIDHIVIFGGRGNRVGGTGTRDLQDVWSLNVSNTTHLSSWKWRFHSIASESETWEGVDDSLGSVSYPGGRSVGAVWSVGEDLLLCGGPVSSGIDALILWKFDTVSDSWEDLEPDPGTPEELFDVLYWKSADEEYLFMFGGDWWVPIHRNSVYKYHVLLNGWETLSYPSEDKYAEIETLPHHPGWRKLGSASVSTPHNAAFLIGGRGFRINSTSTLDIAELWKYDIEAHSWEVVSITLDNAEIEDGSGRFDNYSYPSGRRWPASVAFGSTIMIFGGRVASGASGAAVWLSQVPCPDGTVGNECADFICADGVSSADAESVCSGNGVCLEPNGECVCLDDETRGRFCEERTGDGTLPPYSAVLAIVGAVLGVLALILVLGGVIVACVLCFRQRGNRHSSNIAEFSQSLNSMELGLLRVPIERRCSYARACLEFLSSGLIGDVVRFLSRRGDVCFCDNCVARRHQSDLYVSEAGRPRARYGVPRGWVRFNLSPNDKTRGVLHEWNIAYHGTSPDTASLILQNGGQLLMVGDELANRKVLRPVPGHIGDSFLFVTPSIIYCGNDLYCRPKEFQGNEFKVAFQVRIRPDAIRVQPETILQSGLRRHVVIDPNFSNKRIEWKTKQRGVIVLTDLLVKQRQMGGEEEVQSSQLISRDEARLRLCQKYSKRRRRDESEEIDLDPDERVQILIRELRADMLAEESLISGEKRVQEDLEIEGEEQRRQELVIIDDSDDSTRMQRLQSLREREDNW